MKANDFYTQMLKIKSAESPLVDYYKALYYVIEQHKTQEASYQLFLEVLAQAFQIVRLEESAQKMESKEKSEEKQAEGIKELLHFLQVEINYIEEKGIPTGESLFNWDIHIILERGASWYTGNGQRMHELEKPTWLDLLQLLEVGREYE